MSEEPFRKLAVLLHADVVGSTALVQKNETLAHQRMQDTFRRFAEIIDTHGGIAHEIRGDALVAEFPKASDAVAAAVEFQATNTAHNNGIGDDVLAVVRVGIAMGEVVVADNTITGEGVVLAQRLEQLAEPGGVCIQDAAYQTVPKRLPFDYESLGENCLKGFDDPVKVLAVRQHTEGSTAQPGSKRIESPATLGLPDKPSVAVLPFANMSGDPEQEYFADGITEDIITELSRFRSLFVIARNSSFTFKGQSADITEVGAKLGVAYVVEGSVRKAGNRVRVTAQLVESNTGNHVWAERYDRELEDIFAVQDELVRTITSTVGGRVESAGLARAERLSETSLKAYDHVLRAKAAYLRSTRADNKFAREQLEQAIKYDPLNAQAHRELAEVLVTDWMAHWVEDRDAALESAFDCAKTAVMLDNSYSAALTTLGSIKLYSRDFDGAQHDLDRALAINPNDSETLDFYALYLLAVGRTDDALAQHALSIRSNPFQHFWAIWIRGITFFTAGRYDEAIVTLRSIKDNINEVRGWLAASYAGAGRLDEARDMLEEFLCVAQKDMAVFPGRKVGAWEDYWHGAIQYKNEADFEHLYDALRKAGLED